MRWVLAALCAGAPACGGTTEPGATSGPVAIEPAARAYPPGASVSLAITNLSHERLTYSGCFYRLERQAAGGDWQVVYQSEDPCPAVLEYLEPFATRQTSVTLPLEAATAPHRARFPSIGARRGDEEIFIPAVQFGESFVVRP